SRVQGQLSGSLNYNKFARATDEDVLNANLIGMGFGTVVRDHVFVDARAAIFQLANTGGIAFASPSTIPASQQSQNVVVSFTPIVRESFDGYVDSELRYNYGLTMSGSGGLLGDSTNPMASPLANTTQNDVTLRLATGRRVTAFGSRLTLDG